MTNDDFESRLRRAAARILPIPPEAYADDGLEYAGRSCGGAKAPDGWRCKREFGHPGPCAAYYVPWFPGDTIEWFEVVERYGCRETSLHLSPRARDGLTLRDDYRLPMIGYWKAWWG